MSSKAELNAFLQRGKNVADGEETNLMQWSQRLFALGFAGEATSCADAAQWIHNGPETQILALQSQAVALPEPNVKSAPTGGDQAQLSGMEASAATRVAIDIVAQPQNAKEHARDAAQNSKRCADLCQEVFDRCTNPVPQGLFRAPPDASAKKTRPRKKKT